MLLIKNLVIDGQDSAIETYVGRHDFRVVRQQVNTIGTKAMNEHLVVQTVLDESQQPLGNQLVTTLLRVHHVCHHHLIAEVVIHSNVFLSAVGSHHFHIQEEGSEFNFLLWLHHDMEVSHFPLRISNNLIEIFGCLVKYSLQVAHAEEGLASRCQHSHLSILRMLEIIWFYHVHYLIYYYRWDCDYPLNSVPGNGTGFPDTEKPRNQTLSSDCEAKVRRIFGSCLVVGW